MTAPILHPGDEIHLAVPISPMLCGRELESAMTAARVELETQYGRYDVTIGAVSYSSRLDRPVVVAVFRLDAEASA